MNLRPSILARAIQCPPSLREIETIAGEVGAPALFGHSIHEMVRDWLSGKPVDKPADEEKRKIFNFAKSIWEEVKESFPDPEIEFRMADTSLALPLAGTADVVQFPPLPGGNVNLLDWKTGWLKKNHEPQLMAYAYLACKVSGSRTATITTVWVRHYESETKRFEFEELKTWMEKMIKNIIKNQEKYRTGDACQYCPHFSGCPEIRKIVRRGEKQFEVDFNKLRQEPARYLEVREKLKLIENAIKNFRAAEKVEIKQNGAIDLGNGKEASILTKEKTEIVPETAWPILRNWFSINEVSTAIKIKKTVIDDHLKNKREANRTKKEIKEFFYEELEDAGALQISFTEEVQIKLKGEENE